MDAGKSLPVNRWLPYWAVFQADMQQTVQSWAYRLWVIGSVLAIAGFLTYRFGAYKESTIIQPSTLVIQQILRGSILGCLTLVVVLTAGSISGERGTLADSVLSRGISRYQYFMGKWHSRVVTILGAFWLVGSVTTVACLFLLHDDLTLKGALFALLAVGAIMFTVVSCCVTMSALFHSTGMSIIMAWGLLYGVTLGLSFFPSLQLSPEITLNALPNMLRGEYDPSGLVKLYLWSGGISLGITTVGMVIFAQKDI
ncbi:MAG: ABC transporter permease [Gemmataceae bacterium]|nr:ABC transporter permease [Gemmataceae bacterium]